MHEAVCEPKTLDYDEVILVLAFVLVFAGMGANLEANALNVVILSAMLSVYISMVYCNSRLLDGMATEGNAPRSLMRVNRWGEPVLA